MTRELRFDVTPAENGETAGAFLRSHGFSRKLLSSLKASGGIKRNGEILRTVDALNAGDTVTVTLTDSGTVIPNPDVKAEIAFQNADVIVFNKPAGVPVHPSILHYNDTLGNLYAALCPNSAFRPIHRLDKDTSGLVACAKNRLAAAVLAENVGKTYYAIVDGEITRGGEINAPIGRADGSIIRREIRQDGQRAVTRYTPILTKNGKTLLEITLLTGRTHQIRVHMASIGYPLTGDELYGGNREGIKRQALHCGKMLLEINGEVVRLVTPLPKDMRKILR